MCKDFHKILNNIIITLVKSYYIENKEHNLYKIKFNIIFLDPPYADNHFVNDLIFEVSL